MEKQVYTVHYPGVPGWMPKFAEDDSAAVIGREDLSILLESDLYMDRNGRGFGRRPWIYPVTVTQARYGGTYEGGAVGGLWLAFPVSPGFLVKDGGGWESWNDSDVECAAWWYRANAESWPIGRGDSPEAAWQDLLRLAADKAGISLESLQADPSWPEPEPEPEEPGNAG